MNMRWTRPLQTAYRGTPCALSRAPFARALCDLIDCVPAGASVPDWDLRRVEAGETSLLRHLDHYLPGTNAAVVTVPPWSATDSTHLLDALIDPLLAAMRGGTKSGLIDGRGQVALVGDARNR